jgi:ribosomal protein S18 acetylase RimI-like enzyme
MGRPPSIEISIAHEMAPSVAQYRELYDQVGRPWLWYERRLLNDPALALMLKGAQHELHVARANKALVGFFELNGAEIAFFGLTLPYIGRGIGPWLLDRAIARGFERGAKHMELNTNTLDHPAALGTYCKAGFRITWRETRELQDPRVLWPDVYRWPPA